MDKKHGLWEYGGLFRKREVQLGLLTAVTALALLCAVWNAAMMRQELEYSTGEYCEEITAQMRDLVSYGINAKMTELSSVADSLSKAFGGSATADLEEFLQRKADILEFDALLLLDGEGGCVIQVERTGAGGVAFSPEALSKPAFSPQGEAHMGFLADQTLFYSAPVHMGESSSYVLVGLRGRATMQEVLTSAAFEGQTLSCIVDSGGGLILAPTDLKPFAELSSIFENGMSEELRQIQEGMAGGGAGSVRFTDISGNENLLAYHALQINDWVLLTIVPVDLIAGSVSPYLVRTFLIVGGTALIFLLFLLLLYHIYSDNQRQLARLAFEDSLTGGMNNAAFQLRYSQLTKEQRETGCAVILLNVRRFRLINEKLGFETGSKILRDILRSIEDSVDTGGREFAARCEADHFFLCVGEKDRETIRRRVRDLEEDINRRVRKKYNGNRLSFAAGCYLVLDDSVDIHAIQNRARIAARNEGEMEQEDCVFYNDSVAKRLKREQELDATFDDALAAGEFQVYLQPKVSLDSGRIAGAEALVRWNHPPLGMISPADFIPLLERSGKICRLDLYVFEQVCLFCRQRRQEGRPWYPVSVNLSRCHFYREDFLDDFCRVSEAYGLPEHAVEFELTESMFFDSEYNERIKRGIDRMHELGFLCSMDDFGAGYSSLGVLREFDVDTLKLDRSFFVDMDGEKARDIIRGVVAMAGKLHLKTVAEGIEGKEQIEFLRSIHCDMVQGYYFSPPLPVEEFVSWAGQYEG